MAPKVTWTLREKQLLSDNRDKTAPQLTLLLPGRTASAIRMERKRLRLVTEGYHNKRENKRDQIEALYRQGIPVALIAQRTNVSTETIYRWRRKTQLRILGFTTRSNELRIQNGWRGVIMRRAAIKPPSPDWHKYASDPKALQMVHRIAAKNALKVPWLREEFESRGMETLCLAARAYNPGLGTTFSSYLYTRLAGCMLDVRRAEMPKGYRKHKGHTPTVFTGSDEDDDTHAALGSLSSQELPIGWEVESEDEVLRLTSQAPCSQELYERFMIANGLQGVVDRGEVGYFGALARTRTALKELRERLAT